MKIVWSRWRWSWNDFGRWRWGRDPNSSKWIEAYFVGPITVWRYRVLEDCKETAAMKIRRASDLSNPRDYGNKRERAIAKENGYRHTPGSGAGAVKGDLRRADLMLEVKATRAESFRVTAEIMAKLRNDGLTNGKRGVLIVEIGTGEKFAVLPLSTFEELVPHD